MLSTHPSESTNNSPLASEMASGGSGSSYTLMVALAGGLAGLMCSCAQCNEGGSRGVPMSRGLALLWRRKFLNVSRGVAERRTLIRSTTCHAANSLQKQTWIFYERSYSVGT